MADPHATPDRAAKVIEMDGDSEPVVVRVAGYSFQFEITGRGDASFTLTEFVPDGRFCVLSTGSEW